ncbi:hypothetical protein DM860_006448 [Cuscuta australis]|uniref:30S ribosomal protein S11 n=1 Tax=Cuscuta australis TaxID=267555 RepID=A0A328D7C7_9ASTE|nr:hypothetical protein DM860_006448 [Cuscuta australis]
MFIRRPLSHPSIHNGIINQVSQIFGPRSNWPLPLHALFCSSSFSKPPPMPPRDESGRLSGNNQGNMPPYNGLPSFGNAGLRNNPTRTPFPTTSQTVAGHENEGNNKRNVPPYHKFPTFGNAGLRNNPTRTPFPPTSQADSGHENEGEAVNRSKSMDVAREILGEMGNFPNSFSPFSGNSFRQSQVETDPDIVHVKILRNNTFITVTDSKGNRKFGATAGGLAPGGKVSRFAAESTAEHIGRETRNRNLKSVVMKVNGFTYFKRKKQTILSFKEGFNHSRGDKNPVVYIEDTTRRPHNGCRRKKQRRI